jgi:mannosyltransferase
VIWTVSEYDNTRPRHERDESVPAGPRLGRAPAYQVPRQMGFRIVERWQFNFAQVTRSTRHAIGQG